MNSTRQLLAAALLGLPLPALAHGFGRLYNLPVPFWLYGWGAAAALLLSFLFVAYFAGTPVAASKRSDCFASALTTALTTALRHLRPLLATLSVLLLLLCIATGLFGNRDPYRNFSMTFFWVIFVLGGSYLTALLGNAYALLNPWRVLAQFIARYVPAYRRGRLSYPAGLGDWPALALYLGFIWFELFGHGKPFSLGAMLLVYSLLNLFGVWLIGSAAWFRHCEFFSVFLRLTGLMAVLEYRAGDGSARGRLLWRWPCAGLLRERPTQLSTVVFVFAMLSTTSFDGLRATQWWVSLFWRDPTGIVTALAGSRPILAYAELRPWYIAWESFWLLIGPFLYFAAYALCIALARRCARSTRSWRELALDFGYSVLPIALVYHLTHYATLLLTQGLKIVSLSSDPFGWRWNLFGTAGLLRAPYLPDLGWVWHSQVGLILAGHLVSVWLAHRIALRLWPTPPLAQRSQWPMLALMIALTIAGLWIIAQPLTAELMR